VIVHWSEPSRDLWLVFWEEADSLSISDFKAISLMVNWSPWVWNIKKKSEQVMSELFGVLTEGLKIQQKRSTKAVINCISMIILSPTSICITD
jgi:hypothetical protein